MKAGKLNEVRPDTHSRLRGKEIPSLEEGRKAFAAIAFEGIPRAAKVHMAWMIMLIRQRIVGRTEGRKILRVLKGVDRRAIQDMIATYDPNFYKWRVQFERYLMDKVGAVASCVNIGRTLPPPIYRMRLRESILPLIDATIKFRASLLEKAQEYRKVVMPGYTHNQHAQPMTFGHYLLGLHEPIHRASFQLEQAYDLTNLCDLGCGALAGTSFNIDRELPAKLLGFAGVLEHTNDCVAATDQATNVVAAMMNMAIPMSRAANEMHTWATFEFNMIELSDAICEASSMMPQKKSPCAFEDIRSTLGKVLGCYTEIVCRVQNIMYGDTVEVFETSESVPAVAAEVVKSVNTFDKVLHNMTVKKEVMLDYAQRGFSTATELAAILFREARIPLRIAHAIVGEVVRSTWLGGGAASDITSSSIDQAAIKVIERPLNLSPEALSAALDAVKFVEAHQSQGGVAPKEVSRMVLSRKAELKNARQRHARRLRSLERADKDLMRAVDGILKA
ncbi:MAG: argininosuccinate lyase [Planctomycetota bacterium]|nr:MAG: argininosuccinate lyase [Planctomycetota bacterium]